MKVYPTYDDVCFVKTIYVNITSYVVRQTV